MWGTILFVAFVAFASSEKATFENYKVFRIIPNSEEQLKVLQQIENLSNGYEYWTEVSGVFQPADLMVPPAQLGEFADLMDSNDMKYNVFIDNVQTLIDQENPESMDRLGDYNFTRYHTLDEIYNWMDLLAEKYPGNVKVVVGGQSYEGREIRGVKLSFGPDKPGIFIEGGMHAREWISPATVTYLLNEFLTSEDPKVRKLAETYDWYMFPSFNPDGYVYSHNSNRLWRKTRSKAGLFCKGVDANRNWDYKWREGGSSRIPCMPTYAGSKAFSELETKTMSDYLISIKDKLFGYVAFHSFSQWLVFPYGHTKQHLDNYNEELSIGLKVIDALAQRYGTKYTTGNIAETIYIATGSSLDWVKAKLKLPVTFLYELRDKGKYGFLLPANQIIPNGQEVLDSLVAMFQEANKFGYPKPQQ